MWTLLTKFIAIPAAKVALPVIAVGAVGVLLYLGMTGRWRFGNDGDAGGLVPVFALQDRQETDDRERPPSLLIGIYENRIYFDDEVISLDELEEILARFQNDSDVWELQDVFRASNAVYNDVRDLLRYNNIRFVEN